MRSFKILTRKKNRELESMFPMLQNIDFEETDFTKLVRICIFDHYLDQNEAIELLDNVSKEEQSKRNIIWSSFYNNLSNEHESYLVKYNKEKLVFKQPRSNESLAFRLNASKKYGPIMLALPQNNAVYQQYWDETHLLYCNDEAKIQSLLKTALDSGLHVL